MLRGYSIITFSKIFWNLNLPLAPCSILVTTPSANVKNCINPPSPPQLPYIYIYILYIYIYIHTYIYIYGIHHQKILWSSYRKLAWVGFEPTTTEFRSDALIDWAITPWVQLALRPNFVQQLQFHRLFSVTFHFGCCLRQWPRLF